MLLMKSTIAAAAVAGVTATQLGFEYERFEVWH
jgi:hypothetical protein